LKSNLLKKIFLWAGLTICIFILAKEISWAFQSGLLAKDDFVEYWSASRLNIQGDNPYDPAGLITLQQNVLVARSEPLMMWNPPWNLAILLPFGLLSYPTGRAFWLLLNLAILIFSADWLWGQFQGPPRYRWIAWIAGIFFWPTIFVLRMGQIGPILLAGLVGFLIFQARQKDALAGMCAFLLALKPQLVYLFWPALIFWSWRERRWLILFSAGLTGLLTCAIAWAFNPLVINQYLTITFSNPPLYWATPTLGALLRYVFGPDKTWLQFLPTIFGGLWFVYYYWSHRGRWNWMDQLPIIIPVSLLTTSYGWTFDQVLLLPLVIQAAVWAMNSPLKRSVFVLFLYLLVNLAGVFSNRMSFTEFALWWLLPLWLVLYWLAKRVLIIYPDARLTTGIPASPPVA